MADTPSSREFVTRFRRSGAIAHGEFLADARQHLRPCCRLAAETEWSQNWAQCGVHPGNLSLLSNDFHIEESRDSASRIGLPGRLQS